MAEVADGFIALPGGLGTLEEVFEMLTLTQLRYHAKPCGFLNVAGYYDRLFEFLRHAVTTDFLRPDHYDMAFVDPTPDGLLHQLRKFQPSPAK